MRLIWDLETDGLLNELTKIFCIVALDYDSGNLYRWSDDDTSLPSVASGLEFIANADLRIGHNLIGFDNVVATRFSGIDFNSLKTHDTFIMSQTLKYQRDHKHGLAGWGQHIGYQKFEFDNFTEYSRDMLDYCIRDVHVNKRIYDILLNEFKQIHSKNPLISAGLRIEHDAAIFNATAREQGWNFVTDLARKNLAKMSQRMEEIEAAVHPLLGEREVFIDKEDKTPKFKKDGTYTAASHRIISEYLGRTLEPGDTPLPPGTTFRRSRMEPIELGNLAHVKDWLLDNGWVPDEYQKRKVGWEWVTTGPKLTSSSLRKMGEIGEMIDDYYTLRNRRSVIEGWLTTADGGRLRGNMWTIGTPTFRCRHEVIVNLPAVTAPWGRELRELFRANAGERLVGADSSGNQLRGLCHYVSNPDFTREVIYGDQHQRNADALGCSRPIAKSYLYAYLFGAGDAKLGQVLTGKANPSIGKKSKEDFAKGIKGLSKLKDKLAHIWKNNNGWFPALDGRPVFCGSEHQCLNYLLQSAEGITCKAGSLLCYEEN